MIYRLAHPDDCFHIAWLYHCTYDGKYGLPLMKDLSAMQEFLAHPHNFWVVAEEKGEIVGSVVYSAHPESRYAKVFGAAVGASARGHSISQDLCEHGLDIMRAKFAIDVVYVLTRTVHEAAQIIIERLGYKKIGVFPNIHKGDSYETHCLAALYAEGTLNKRYTNYKIHHKIKKLSDIVCNELDIPTLDEIYPELPTKKLEPSPELEFLEAPRFAQARHAKLSAEGQLFFEFHSLEAANVILTSCDQAVEVFVNLAKNDGHCEILGIKMPDNISYTNLLLKTTHILRDYGARYVEIGVPASKPKIVDSILKAKFVPCAFFPAFMNEKNYKIDYLVLSRTFENFDFQALQFRGLNAAYLQEYFNIWKDISLTPRLLDGQNNVHKL